MSFQIRPATRKELDIMVEWAAKEGWNPGLYDADAFYATDPQGFFMGFLDNEPIASLSAVSYSPAFGFLGLYIVKPEYRGNGYGWKLWQEALKHLGDQNIGLDGVVGQQENYKKSGFKLAYRNIRYEGKGSSNVEEKSTDIVKLSELPFEKLVEYDTSLFPVPRPEFLRLWVQQPESLALGFVDEEQIGGYGVVRKC